MKKTTAFVSIFLLGLFVSTTVFAADYLPKDKEKGGNVVVGGDEVFENLYVGGGSVSVNKEVLGDLFIGAGSINVSGETEEDLFAAGGNVNISSPVGGDARIAGGNVNLSAPIGGDLLAAGGTIVISSSADIGGDMWLAGGMINFNSTALGEARLAGGEIYINGEINGPVTVYAEKLTFGPQAVVSGAITYYGRTDALVEDGAVVGSIEMKEWKEGVEKNVGENFATSAFWVFLLLKLLALFVAGLVLLKLFGKRINEVVRYSEERPGAMLGVGVLAIIVTPIIAMILLVTVVGAYLGVLLGLTFAMLSILAGIVTLFYTGSLVQRFVLRSPESKLSWKTLLLGVVAGGILTLIPVLGWLAMLVLFLISFGSMFRLLRGKIEM